MITNEEKIALSAFAKLANPSFMLGASAMDNVLSEKEKQTLTQVENTPCSSYQGPHSSITCIVKVTRLCNLRCKYCFDWRADKNSTMSFEVLLKTIRDLVCSNASTVQFVWHGGETTLRSLAFYKKIVWLQQRYKRAGQTIVNSIQTNAVGLNKDWALFFKLYNFTVGVSIDGPSSVHDKRRVDTRGRPTFDKVIAGIKLLKDYKVKSGALMVLDEQVMELGAKQLVQFWLDYQITNVGLINVIPKDLDVQKNFLPLHDYYNFLIEVFDHWLPYRDKIRVREFDALTNNILKKSVSYCVYEGGCVRKYFTVEPNGDISSCDKYLPEGFHIWGNVLNEEGILSQIDSSTNMSRIEEFAHQSRTAKKGCSHNRICHGGCPNDATNFFKATGFHASCCGAKPLIKRIEASL